MNLFIGLPDEFNGKLPSCLTGKFGPVPCDACLFPTMFRDKDSCPKRCDGMTRKSTLGFLVNNCNFTLQSSGPVEFPIDCRPYHMRSMKFLLKNFNKCSRELKANITSDKEYEENIGVKLCHIFNLLMTGKTSV